ncbi:MAG: sugar phosphate isomerase/epimerase family protein [Nitrososphaeria archaeon]
MKLGLTVAYARVMYHEMPTVEDYVKLAEWGKKNGFEGFELAAFSLDHFRTEFLNRNRLKYLVKNYRDIGISCNSFEAGFLRHMIIDPLRESEQKTLNLMKEIIDVSNTLDTDLIYAHTAPHPSWKIEWKRLYDEYSPPSSISVPETFSWKREWNQYVNRVRNLVELSEKAGLYFALEIRPYEIISNSDSMLNLINDVGSKKFGLVFDTAHFFVQKEILPIALEKLQDHVFLIHLADNDGCTDYHWAPGKGKIDWENFLRTVKKIGYKRFLNIDVAGKYDDIGKEILDGKNFILNLCKKTG